MKTAQLLQKERNKCSIYYPVIEKSELETEKLSTVTEIVSTMIHETWDHLKLVKLCNSVVYEYLKNHEKSSVRELADEFRRIVPIQSEGTIPTFQEVSDGFRFRDNNNAFKR